ncbi:hypothetical protein MCAV_00820 [[Mycoplasma] cavipharyngis]|uniref:hypothetical protein n=1 Tax=[Mycoplasma] cavipharyngis TaxID=92757 RepID=UPI0037045926
MNKKVTLTIEISEKDYQKLKEQLTKIKADPNNFAYFAKANTIEELVAIYITQFANVDEIFGPINEQMSKNMEEVLNQWKEKGFNFEEFIQSIFDKNTSKNKQNSDEEKKPLVKKKN